MLNAIKKLLTFTTLIFGVLLAISNLSVYINPSYSVFPALLGLAFPVLFLVNVSILVFTRFSKKKWLVVQICVLLLSVPNLLNFFNFYSASQATKESAKLKIVSYNVRGFNRYSWLPITNVKGKIEDMLKEENPDVICFQEFHLNGKDDSQAIKLMMDRLGMKYYISNNLHQTKQVAGLVILSKYPIKKIYRQNFNAQKLGGNGLLVADVILENKTVWRVANFHLQSIKFEQPDYDYAKNPTKDKDGFSLGVLRIINRFIKAYALRGNQANILFGLLKSSPYPVIAAGDANDPPVSYTYRVLQDGLHDSFKQKGSFGAGRTYAGNMPSYRIDYIFTDKSIHTLSHKVLNNKLSDHYPLVVELY